MSSNWQEDSSRSSPFPLSLSLSLSFQYLYFLSISFLLFIIPLSFLLITLFSAILVFWWLDISILSITRWHRNQLGSFSNSGSWWNWCFYLKNEGFKLAFQSLPLLYWELKWLKKIICYVNADNQKLSLNWKLDCKLIYSLWLILRVLN